MKTGLIHISAIGPTWQCQFKAKAKAKAKASAKSNAKDKDKANARDETDLSKQPPLPAARIEVSDGFIFRGVRQSNAWEVKCVLPKQTN